MNGYLLDTNVALLAVHESKRLSVAVKAALEEGPAFLSALSFWEVMIKSRKGTLDVDDPRQWWAETLAAPALQPLLQRPEHIPAIYDLPPIHLDPFDRGLISQAIVEDLILVTTDTVITEYASESFHVVR